jgi:hypothetical protein
VEAGDSVTARHQVRGASSAGVAELEAELAGKADAADLPYDVRQSGVVGDGTTDDSAAMIHAVGVCTGANKRVLYVPAELNVRVNSQINMQLVRRVDCQGTITVGYTGGPGVIIGDSSAQRNGCKYYFRRVTWAGVQTNVALRVVGLKQGMVEVGYCDYMQLYAEAAVATQTSIAYSEFYLGRILKLELYGATGTSWINENNFYGGSFDNLIIDAVSYAHNANIFHGCSVEGSTSTIQILKGSCNRLEVRGEGGPQVTFGSGTWANQVIGHYVSSSGVHGTPMVLASDGGTENVLMSSHDEKFSLLELLKIDNQALMFNSSSEWTTLDASVPVPGFDKLRTRTAFGAVIDTGIIPVRGTFALDGGTNYYRNWALNKILFDSDVTLWRPQIYAYDAAGVAIDPTVTPWMLTTGGWTANAGGYYAFGANQQFAQMTLSSATVASIRIVVTPSGSAGDAFGWVRLMGYVIAPQPDTAIQQVKRAIRRPLYQTAAPTQGLAKLGREVQGSTAGYSCTSRVDTTLSVGASISATSITVTSATGMANGDVIGVLMDTGQTHWTTISGAPAGSVVTLAVGLTAAAAAGKTVGTNRWGATAKGGSAVTTYTGERDFLAVFSTSANEKVDLYFTGDQFATIEVTLTGYYAGANATGTVKAVYSLAGSNVGVVYTSTVATLVSQGTLPDHFGLTAASWDATNSRWKITIAHRTTTTNTIGVLVKWTAATAANHTNIRDSIAIGTVYTTDSTVVAAPLTSWVKRDDQIIDVTAYPYLADRTGVANANTAIAAAITAAGSTGTVHFPAGTYKTTTTLAFTCNVTASAEAIISYTGSSIAVQVGTNTSGVFLNRKRYQLPRVVNAAKSATGWAAANVVGTTGVKIINLNRSTVDVPHITNFETGLDVHGNGQGTAYVTFNIGSLDNNKVNLRLSAINSGWSNQNTFIGGSWSHASNEGTSVAGTRHIVLEDIAVNADPNNNVFLNPSLESPSVVEYTLHINGSYNVFIAPRFEWTGDHSKIWWGASAFRNWIIGGNDIDGVIETHNGGFGNSIIGTSGARWTPSSSQGIVIDNEGSSSNASLTVMRAGGATLGDNPLTAYTWRWQANLLRGKRYTDAFDRIVIDPANGTIATGTGAATPTVANLYPNGEINAGDPKYGTPGTRAAFIAALDAAEALGKHTIVRIPAGLTIDVVSTLSMSGRSCQIIGAGAGATSATVANTSVIKASAQTGPVLDFAGYLPPYSFKGKIRPLANVMIQGSGIADATKVNSGIKMTAMSSAYFHDIAIMNTGGPCLELASSPGNAVYLCDFERFMFGAPVSAGANDVPWVYMNESNGNRFRGFGFRAHNATGDVGASGAVVFEGNVTYAPHDNLFDAWWFENLHVPTGGTFFHHAGNMSMIRDFQFFDCTMEAGAASGTSFYRFVPPVTNSLGGNHLSGVIPGDNNTAVYIHTGVDMQQSRNSVVGVKGYRAKNITVASGIDYTYVRLAGSVAASAGSASAFVINSVATHNVLIDEINGDEYRGGVAVRLAGVVQPKVVSTTSSAAPTPAVDTAEVYAVTALAVGATFGAPTGTPADGQPLLIRVKDNGSPQTLAWNAIYRAVGTVLPTTTVATKVLYVGARYNAVATKWDVLAVAVEA